MTLDELRRRYKEEILCIAEKYGVRNIRVFGSVARGKATADSDIDMLVETPKAMSLLKFSGLRHAMEDVLHRKVDLLCDEGLSPYLKDDILREARRL